MADTFPGIDVSTFQGIINWSQVKADGVRFAMIRSSYGWEDPDRQTDARFRENVEGAKQAGIPVGAYHYSYATNVEQAEKEAEFFLNIIAGSTFEYPVALDMEDASQRGLPRETLTDIAYTFLSRVEEAGYYVMLYANLDWLVNRLDMDRLSRFDVWLAQWSSDPTYTGSFGIWQYTSNGRVNGISPQVDRDISYRDYPTLIREAGLNGLRPGDTVSVGQEVRLKEGTDTFADGTSVASFVKDTLLYVRELDGDKALVSTSPTGSEYTGWFWQSDLTPVENAPALRVGAKVRYHGRLYASSTGNGPGRTVDGTFTVTRILPDRVTGVLLDNGLGWVSADALSVVG